MRAGAPWSIAVQLSAVTWWQERTHVPHLRCPNDDDHPPLAPFYDGRFARVCCLVCDYQRVGVPEAITRAYVHHHLERLDAAVEE